MRKVAIISLLFLAGLFILSCKKITNPEPGPPVITFMDFTVVSEDEAYFHFKFTDPDGDIGLKDSDSSGGFAMGAPYHFDFHLSIYKYDSVNNTYVPGYVVVGKDTSGNYHYRIPYVDNKSRDKSLTGEIIVKLAGYRPVTYYKKFRYNFFIYDRAHHKSNVVTTPDLYHP